MVHQTEDRRGNEASEREHRLRLNTCRGGQGMDRGKRPLLDLLTTTANGDRCAREEVTLVTPPGHQQGSLHQRLQKCLGTLQTLQTLQTCWLCSPRRVLFLLLVLLLPFQHAVSAQETCAIEPLEMQISYGNCQARRVLLAGCSGQCFSYARPNPNLPDQLDRSCRCCSKLGRRRLRVVLRCPARGNPRRVRRVALLVFIPRGCACRPCSG